MPEEVKRVFDASISLSLTSNHGHYQGGDRHMCVEEINKEGKSWSKMSGGVPNETCWCRVYRNLPKLKSEILDLHY